METNSEAVGLTTRDALQKLYKEVELVLKQFEASQKTRKFKSWKYDALHHSSQYTTVNWISAALVFTIAICFILTYFFTAYSSASIYEGVLLLIILTLNIYIELYDNKMRHTEVPNQVRCVLNTIKTTLNNINWSSENYPQLCSPFSPCITLQWTYRDNKLINLPWSLLVKGDIILIRPGQISPGYCECLEKHSEYPLLHGREIYAPTLQNANEVFSAPKVRKPLKNVRYRLLETPYLNNLHIALEQALDRPVTQHNQQRQVMVKIMERFVLPIMLLIVYLVNCIKYFYLEGLFGSYPLWDLFVLLPLKVVLPLLPLMFPVAWNALNYLGMARFQTLFESIRKVHVTQTPFEEDQGNSPLSSLPIKYEWKDVWCNFLNILKGNILCRSANILHVLGSVSALCCVDKKGILSWPNPAPEKVFFLINADDTSQNSSLANLGELNGDADSIDETSHRIKIDSPSGTVAEVLDLTHHHDNPFKVHFDDTSWKEYITNIKPLGLAILLNTCNLETQEHYTAFCSHITCEAMYNENLVPVTNRRCLCSLPTEIGFVDQAQKIFSLEQQLCTYRHLQPEMVRRDNKYARSLQLSTKLKFPFPHMFATVVKELSSGTTQLLSEGTADIILDSCADFWDGNDLCPLSLTDRKKIQDFYQRSSLTAYCTAFAYRPLSRCINGKLSDVYLELPSDSRHLYTNNRSPTPLRFDCQNVLEPKLKTALSQFYSTDSLLCGDGLYSDISDMESCFEMQCNQIFIGMVTMQYQAQSDMVHLIEQLENACIRFVHFSKENELRSRVFSEKMGLESGWNCHISLLSERTRRESELQECWANNGTARVNSPADMPQRKLKSKQTSRGSPPYEKKYYSYIDSHLESSRTMSFSAPSAINMDQPTVKFDFEHEHLMKEHVENDNQNTNEVKSTSQESVQIHAVDLNSGAHEWQSLSCLTDSTEHSAPINFDMSNRAKLPRGIDKIRPHIELIDNVPLLVSLFTDCTATVTREMLHIMQDYGEVVCVIGSVANCENIGIFMQADASIAVEPLYPQICQKEKVYTPVENKDSISPIDLARMLNSVACSLSVKREDPISIYHLIMEARHYMLSLWNTVQFWLCCCLTLTFMQAAASVLLMPALLTVGQLLWFICLVIPVLSISLMGIPVNSEVMKKPLGKNQLVFNVEVSLFVLWCYGLKFLPVIFSALISFTGILSSHCADLCVIHNCTCTLYYSPLGEINMETVGGWLENSYSLLMARHVVVVIVLVHFIIISVGFVHREFLLWNRSPHTNVLWMSTVFFLVCLQSLYTAVGLKYIDNWFEVDVKYEMPLWVIVFASISPLISLVVDEVVKHQEIQVNKRFQRRARLDFGTKLGMNSPF